MPRDKAKRISTWPSYIEPQIRKELLQKGTTISTVKSMKWLCISCAVHRGVVKVRAKDERRSKA